MGRAVKYLIRNKVNKKTRAHIWLGDDTACTMHSTGGLAKERYSLHNERYGLPICLMCINNMKKRCE